MNSRKPNNASSDWPAQNSKLAKSFELFCRTLFKTYCPLKVYGQKNLPKGPFLICSNHASHMDSSMLMVAANTPFKNIGLIAAKDYFFDHSNMFFLHYMMNLIPIARGSGSKAIKDGIASCRSFLEHEGSILVIYPEGTRATHDGISKFKEGAAILAHKLALPIVPAAVIGSMASLPKGSYFLKPKKVCVRFGTPIKVSDWLAFDEKDDRRATFHAYREATVVVEKQVRELYAQGL